MPKITLFKSVFIKIYFWNLSSPLLRLKGRYFEHLFTYFWVYHPSLVQRVFRNYSFIVNWNIWAHSSLFILNLVFLMIIFSPFLSFYLLLPLIASCCFFNLIWYLKKKLLEKYKFFSLVSDFTIWNWNRFFLKKEQNTIMLLNVNRWWKAIHGKRRRKLMIVDCTTIKKYAKYEENKCDWKTEMWQERLLYFKILSTKLYDIF